MQTYQQIRAVLARAGAAVDDGLVWLQRRGGPCQRVATSTGIAVVLHGLALWMLIISNPQVLQDIDLVEEAVDAEIYTFEPPPETEVEPAPVIQPRERVEAEPPQEVEAQPPQPQPEPVEVPRPAPETYRPLPKAIVVPRDDLDSAPNVEAKPVPDRALRASPIAAPTLEAEPDPRQLANLKAKKKEEDGQIESKSLSARAPGLDDLNLHEAPFAVPSGIVPSGLTAEQPGRSAGEGTPPAGAAGGGGLKGGRSGVTQALQNHDSCVALQQAGKPIPANCNMKELAQMKGLGTGDPAGRSHYGPIVAGKEANDRYKRAAGNADYWNRVNRVPNSRDKDRAPAAPGTYTKGKDQRVTGQCALNNSCGQ